MKFKWLKYIVLSSAVLAVSTGMEKASIYMERSDFDDQAASASGYVFQSNSGGPVTFSGYSDASRNLARFGRPPIPLRVHGAQQLQPQSTLGQTQFVPAGVLQPPLQHYGYHHGVPADYSTYVVPTIDQRELQQVNLATTLNGVPFLPGGHLIRYGGGNGGYGIGGGHVGGGYGIGGGYGGLGGIGGELANGEHFVKEGGKKYDEEKHASHGEKGETGYNTAEGFQKGSQGKHEEESDKGYHKQEGANRASHHDAGEQYGKKEEEAKGVKGQSFSHSSSHKKGSKTKGFHKTYHKDEYKKDHTFYDEADDRGHYNQYENHHSNHAANQGAVEKGERSEAGYKEHEKGKKGHSDEGKYIDHDSVFKAAQGENAYHNDASEYAKNAGKEAHEQHGYNEHQSEKYAL